MNGLMMEPYMVKEDPKGTSGVSLVDNTTAQKKLDVINTEKAANGLANEMTNKALLNVDVGYGISAGELSNMTGMSPTEALNYVGTPEGDKFVQKYAQDKHIAMNNMISANRKYNAAKDIASYKPVAPTAEDVKFYAADGVDVAKGYDDDMENYHNAVDKVKDYKSNIDEGLSAKWKELR